MAIVAHLSLRLRLLLLMLFAVLLPTAGFLLHISADQHRLAEAMGQHKALHLVQSAFAAQNTIFNTAYLLLLNLSRQPLIDKLARSQRCQTALQELLKTEPYYTNIGIASIDGRVLCSALPERHPANIVDRAYLRHTLASGGFRVGRLASKSSINLAVPVFNARDKPRFLLFAALDLSRLNQIIAHIPAPPGSILLLADNKGSVLAHVPDPQSWTGKSIAQTPLMQAILAHRGDGTATISGTDGITRNYSFASLPIGSADSVYIAAGVPETSASPATNRLLLRSGVIFALFALMALATVWVGSDYLIVRRMNAIRRAAGRLADGDISARTGLQHSTDELGAVAHGFDNMAAKLQRDHAQLDAVNIELKRINHALKTLSSGSRALIRAVDEKTLLADMCRLIVDTGGYRMAWVGYIEHDAEKSIRPVAKAGLEDGYLENLNLSWADTSLGQGPGGVAIRSGVPCIVPDILTDTRFAPWRNDALRRGYVANICLPIKVHGVAIGILAIYSEEHEAFTGEEVSLLEELAEDLAFGIETLRTRGRSEKAHETIWRMAYYDPITGLPNHARFENFIEQILLDEDGDHSSFALLMLDIERFHEFNDALGVEHGNTLLREVGGRIRNMLPETEMLARMRGDNFAVLLPQSDISYAIQTAQSIRNSLEKPFSINELLLDVGMNIGIALFPQHGNQADLLLRRADLAVRRARELESGYAVYDPVKDDDSPQRLGLVADLRQAIEGNQLILYYQPKIDMRNGRLCGVEALARWRHPIRGLVPPDQFIPLAEQSGLIRPLTYRVLEIALQQTRAWSESGFRVPISVNLSARNLRDPALVERITNLIDANGVAYELLELEITETAIMTDPNGALDLLTRLNNKGITLAIDDFGTGYSSLSYLKKLPSDSIKIDKSFVIDMLTNKDSAAIVRSTIALAHDLDISVIAEGIECDLAWQQLAALGCDMAQGYHVGRPMPVIEFDQWLRQSCPGEVWNGRKYAN